jgi:hypothetical protein
MSSTALPAGNVRLAAVERAGPISATLPQTAETKRLRRRTPQRRVRLLLAGGITIAAVVAVVITGRSGADHKRSHSPVPTISRGHSATDTPEVRNVRTLQWKAVPHASFYNVVLVRNGVRVLDVWPRRNHLSLAALTKRRGRVPAGRYKWFVYPGYGNRSERGRHSTFYGEVAAQGTVVIRAGSTKSRQ